MTTGAQNICKENNNCHIFILCWHNNVSLTEIILSAIWRGYVCNVYTGNYYFIVAYTFKYLQLFFFISTATLLPLADGG